VIGVEKEGFDENPQKSELTNLPYRKKIGSAMGRPVARNEVYRAVEKNALPRKNNRDIRCNVIFVF